MSHFSLFSCSVATLSCRIYVVFCQCLRRLLQYLHWITAVLLLDYSSTPYWITPVLALDYCSTSIGLLQYFYRITPVLLSESIKVLSDGIDIDRKSVCP